MVVVGFVLYQIGFSYELRQAALLRTWLDEFVGLLTTWSLRSEVAAIVLQFTGGVLLILGLLVCFTGINASDNTRFAGKYAPRSRATPKVNVTNCRFCGEKIREDASFCPSCEKSQR